MHFRTAQSPSLETIRGVRQAKTGLARFREIASTFRGYPEYVQNW